MWANCHIALLSSSCRSPSNPLPQPILLYSSESYILQWFDFEKSTTKLRHSCERTNKPLRYEECLWEQVSSLYFLPDTVLESRVLVYCEIVQQNALFNKMPCSTHLATCYWKLWLLLGTMFSEMLSSFALVSYDSVKWWLHIFYRNIAYKNTKVQSLWNLRVF